MKTLIVGEGRTLYFLCRAFASKGHSVAVVDPRREECLELASRLKIQVIHGDGSDPDVLEEAGARQADVALAIAPEDHDNLVICQFTRLYFGVPRVVALVNDPDNEPIFKEFGIAAFSLTRTASRLIEQQAAADEIASLIPVGEGRVNLTELVLRADAPLVGRRLDEAALPENALLACVVRAGQPLIPRGTTQLQEGDRIVLISLPENHGQVIRAVTGDRG
jgi:trk system potassium uptake protein TrkA